MSISPAHEAVQFEANVTAAPREDLERRTEIKYLLPGADVGKLRRLLEVNCRPQVHNNPVSEVRSVYFDDFRLSAARANLAGIGQRRKLRLRWYDSLQPGNMFFFEIKWRNNRVTGKHRLQVKSSRPLSELTYAEIVDGLRGILPEHLQLDLAIYCEPIVIVQYEREHFTSWDGALRMTIDYNLTYYDQVGRASVYTDFGHRLNDVLVLEGKVPVGRESDLRELLYPYAPRIGRCSKYVQGLRALGHLRDD